MHVIPLISPRPFSEFSPQEFHEYVKSLHQEPERAAPPAEFTVRLNAKGNPVITIRREPKFLNADEVDSAAVQAGWTKQRMWLHVLKKKIPVRRKITCKAPAAKGK